MADTIITNSPERERDGGSSAGWAVAVIILIAVVVGGILLYRHGMFRSSAPSNTNINVTVPNPLDSKNNGGNGY